MCQWARVTAAETLGRGELSIGIDVSVVLLLSLSVKYACDGLDVRGCVISAADWCRVSGAWNRRDVVPVLLVIVVVVGGAEWSSVEEVS